MFIEVLDAAIPLFHLNSAFGSSVIDLSESSKAQGPFCVTACECAGHYLRSTDELDGYVLLSFLERLEADSPPSAPLRPSHRRRACGGQRIWSRGEKSRRLRRARVRAHANNQRVAIDELVHVVSVRELDEAAVNRHHVGHRDSRIGRNQLAQLRHQISRAADQLHQTLRIAYKHGHASESTKR